MLILDLETVPSSRPDLAERLAAKYNPPGNYKDPAKIEAHRAEWIADALASAGLDGCTGELAAIGWAVNDAEPRVISRRSASEGTIIEEFFQSLTGAADHNYWLETLVPLVGHNLVAFDLPFLWARCRVLGIRPPHWFPLPVLRPWDDRFYDTMAQWTGSSSRRVSLDTLAWALGLPGKSGSGAEVAAWAAAGDWQRIEDYCRQDVALTRDVYRAMTFTRRA